MPTIKDLLNQAMELADRKEWAKLRGALKKADDRAWKEILKEMGKA